MTDTQMMIMERCNRIYASRKPQMIDEIHELTVVSKKIASLMKER